MTGQILIHGDNFEMISGVQAEANVLGVPIAVCDMPSAIAQIGAWAKEHEPRSVYFCNAHSVATANADRSFRDVLLTGDLRLPDGAPVAFSLRRGGHPKQQRVSGPDLMLEYFRHAERAGEAIFLYGSTPETLGKLAVQLSKMFPRLVVHSYSPPYRELTPEEDAAVIEMISQSGARTAWVALGCPKQEKWIADHKGALSLVMLGVGAAFAFHAGVISRAPLWMQRSGLEWLHRLISDPKRLWRRYLVTNSLFIFYSLRQLSLSRLYIGRPRLSKDA